MTYTREPRFAAGPKPEQDDSEVLREVRDRTRRLETRMTRFMEAQGFDVGVRRPRWRGGDIDIPSMAVEFHEIVNAIPKDYEGTVNVYHKDKLIVSMTIAV